MNIKRALGTRIYVALTAISRILRLSADWVLVNSGVDAKDWEHGQATIRFMEAEHILSDSLKDFVGSKPGIDKSFLVNAAKKLQLVRKSSAINYDHGVLLYSALRDYILSSNKTEEPWNINVLEIGTARGFSSICMAKALSDSGAIGTIYTVDILPHSVPVYWNSISDRYGKMSREDSLSPWQGLTEKYVTFIQGQSIDALQTVHIGRINFAFLDGLHTPSAVLKEFSYVQKRQLPGDLIVFDDFNVKYFGLRKEVQHMCSSSGYIGVEIISTNDRSYYLARKS